MNLFYIENAYNGTNTVTLTSKQVGVVSSGFYATSVQYSKDGSSWSTFYLSDGSTNTVTLNANEKVYFRNDSGKWNYFNTPNFCTSFKGDHPHIIGGDARSLLNYSNDNITLSQGCFYNLFFEDTQLTDASGLSLPSTTIATDAYKCMFKGCTSLTTPPSLQSAVNLNADCFEAMFSGCSSLTTAPVLRSTNLAFNCYGYMFHNCTALTAAPALPATTLADSCYSGMFQGCTSLTTPPVLPATTLIDYCYKQMFSGCSSLSSVVTYANDISATNCLYNWLSGVANSGTFRNLGSATYPTNSASGIPTGWSESTYFYIENTYSGSNTVTLTTTKSGTPTTGTYATSVEYSKDKRNWSSFTLTAGGTNTVSLRKNERVYFRNNSGQWNKYNSSTNNFYTTFTASQSHTVVGNANTLIDHEDPYNATLSEGCFVYLFNGDTNLTSSVKLELPSMTLANNCYRYMFLNCSSMTGSTSLPATTLAQNCYYQMFEGCTSLTTAPTLPVTTLAQNCYFQMFRDCTSLTTAPALPATTLAQNCYYQMFSGCKNLTTAPALPATTLARECYYDMFRGCSSLTSAPSLPATTLASYCYKQMFFNCTGLTTAPTLPATKLASSCYESMFSGCTSLNEVTTYANDISASSCISNWLQNVSNSGTFHNNGSATYTPNSASGIPTGWTEVGPTPSKTITATAGQNGSISPSGAVTVNVGSGQTFTVTPDTGYIVDTLTVDGSTATLTNDTYTFSNVQADHTISVTFKLPDLTDYFYIENTYNGQNTVTLTTAGSSTGGQGATSVEYSKDKNSWTTLTLTSGGTNTITLESGEKVYFRNDSGKWNYYNNMYYYYTIFTANQTHIAGGNANTLIKYSDLTNVPLIYGGFYRLFYNNTNLTSAANLSLPSTTLALSYYTQMFMGCSSLTSAPSTLPATTLANDCYQNMFTRCSSLTTAPTLPATTLTQYCYQGMFYGCTSLTTAPTLPATTLTQYCYHDMFRDCRNLTTAPSLPATTLVTNCYNNMFYDCTSLNEVTTYANDISASNCITDWLKNVAATGTFYNNGSATYTVDSPSGIPVGWTEVRPSKTITATAGSNGSISPSGAVSVNIGSDQTFTFIPDTGYEVDTVTVDGSTVTLTNNTYTFSNVQSDHTISVTFKVQTFTINATAGQNGSISPSGSTTVNYGSSQTYTIIPDTGYEIDTLSIDGYATTPVSSYTFNNITASHTISVTFKLRTFTITAQGSHHALISPSGSVSVNYGADITFTLSSEQGYELDKLYVDGVETSYTGSTYTFTNVQSDHTIEIQAKIITFTLTSTAGQNGSISPSGSTTVNYGSSQTYTITPNIGYEIDTLTVDGSVVTSNTTYTFSNITANHAISVTFKLRTFTITATNSEGGEISPDGIITVEYDDDATFEITPSTGYLLWELLVDGVDKKDELVDNTYTFENVTANHTIHAVFDDIYLIVSVTSGPNGSITPTGDVEVIYNGNQIFNITPNEGYEIDKVMLDGVDVTDDVEDFNYTMRNIVENHILEVSFKETYIPEPKGFNLTGMKNTDYVKQYKK